MGVMRTLRVVGIGAGSPDHITRQAIAALSSTRAVFALGKGEVKDDLLEVRRTILRDNDIAVPIIEIPDPPRDRNPANYKAEVYRWHQRRAELLKEAIETHLPDGAAGAFMVWGDPSLYDSTLRIIERIRALGLDIRTEVFPGITAVQALTAAHGVLINRVGEAITITTGRNLTDALDKASPSAQPAAYPDAHTLTRNTVVMLDGKAAWTHPSVDAEHTYMWWGAYLGTPQQVLRAGWLAQIGEEVAALKAQLREDHGWIMDTYLLRSFEDTSVEPRLAD